MSSKKDKSQGMKDNGGAAASQTRDDDHENDSMCTLNKRASSRVPKRSKRADEVINPNAGLAPGQPRQLHHEGIVPDTQEADIETVKGVKGKAAKPSATGPVLPLPSVAPRDDDDDDDDHFSSVAASADTSRENYRLPDVPSLPAGVAGNGANPQTINGATAYRSQGGTPPGYKVATPPPAQQVQQDSEKVDYEDLRTVFEEMGGNLPHLPRFLLQAVEQRLEKVGFSRTCTEPMLKVVEAVNPLQDAFTCYVVGAKKPTLEYANAASLLETARSAVGTYASRQEIKTEFPLFYDSFKYIVQANNLDRTELFPSRKTLLAQGMGLKRSQVCKSVQEGTGVQRLLLELRGSTALVQLAAGEAEIVAPREVPGPILFASTSAALSEEFRFDCLGLRFFEGLGVLSREGWEPSPTDLRKPLTMPVHSLAKVVCSKSISSRIELVSAIAMAALCVQLNSIEVGVRDDVPTLTLWRDNTLKNAMILLVKGELTIGKFCDVLGSHVPLVWVLAELLHVTETMSLAVQLMGIGGNSNKSSHARKLSTFEFARLISVHVRNLYRDVWMHPTVKDTKLKLPDGAKIESTARAWSCVHAGAQGASTQASTSEAQKLAVYQKFGGQMYGTV